MTNIINDNPIRLLDWFIFATLLTDSVFGIHVYVQIHVAIISLNYLSSVTASLDKSICAAAKSDLCPSADSRRPVVSYWGMYVHEVLVNTDRLV